MEKASPPSRIGLYICHCGTNIAEAIDLGRLVDFGHDHEQITVVREGPFLCAEDGQQMIRRDIRTRHLDRVVVAACSPLMHESTFRHACQAEGLNPFQLQIANIRDQVSWVEPDRERATRKSQAMVAAAVRRVVHHRPLEVRRLPVTPAVLVVGAGIAGIEAALRLANAGQRVVLVEKAASIGGHMALLDRTYPTLDCAACILVPRMAQVAEHPRIELHTCSEVESVSGSVGCFGIRIAKRARFVDAERCNGCALCIGSCPVDSLPSEVDRPLGKRRAIHFPFSQAVPNLPLIDAEHCGNLANDDGCEACAAACPSQAIDFAQKGERIEVEVGAIVLATGYRLFDPSLATQYGYGRWPNIVTSLEFERMCHPSGPTGGEIRLVDGSTPQSIAVLHCVGSRDERFNRHCSRICCMSSLKLAHQARQRTGARVFSFYLDMRASGQYGEEFYEQVQRSGVVFVHGKGTEVIGRGGHLLVKAEDTHLGRRIIVPVDLVVLGVGLEAQADAQQVASRFGIGCDTGGFFQERHLKLAPVETTTPGIFIAGACQGPKSIPESIAQAGAAAVNALELLDQGEVETIPTVAEIDPERCSGCELCLRDCPYSAIEREETTGRLVARVNGPVCRSCGICVATCPSGAITQFGFTQQQIMAEIEGLLEDLPGAP